MEKLNSQARICEIIRQLSKKHIAGLSNKELAKIVGTSDANLCRDLIILQKFNWITRSERGTWRLSPEFGKITASIAKSYREAYLRLKENEALYSD